jgi:hypothetical protein
MNKDELKRRLKQKSTILGLAALVIIYGLPMVGVKLTLDDIHSYLDWLVQLSALGAIIWDEDKGKDDGTAKPD